MLPARVGSGNRHAASQHLQDFRQGGEAFRAFLLRQCQMDTLVVEGLLHELLQTPLACPPELAVRVKAQ
ncbi:MAG: hypothetical protein HYZ81_13645 [Nitrospinae bacterium]|nr:hypothetical protein [Nitrospinota bacterium]